MTSLQPFNRKQQSPINSQIPLDLFLRSYADALDTKPIYQRGHFRNDIEFVKGILKSVRENSPIIAVLLYKFQPTDYRRCLEHIWEVVDGVHRITVIICFMKGTYITVTTYKNTVKLIMPYLYDSVNKEQILYKETKDTIEYIAENSKSGIRIRYMTDEERNLINSYYLPIQEIPSPHTVDERRKIFLNVQNTIPVKNNDLLKNNTDIQIIQLFHDNGIYEMFDIIHRHQWKKGEMYKTLWLIRYFILSNREYSIHMEGWNLEQCITKTDDEIEKNIKNNKPYLINISNELWERFVKDFTRFTAYIESLSDDTCFSSHMMHALYEHLRMSEIGHEEILITHSKKISDNEPKDVRCVWIKTKNDHEDSGDEYECDKVVVDKRKISTYFKYFTQNLHKLENIKTVYIPPPPKPIVATVTIKRKPIPKKNRDKVWENNVGEQDKVGKCFTCDTDIHYKVKGNRGTFDCGHIISHANGGKDTVENLRPQCVNCNRSQGSEHMYSFMKREFPHVYKLNGIVYDE